MVKRDMIADCIVQPEKTDTVRIFAVNRLMEGNSALVAKCKFCGKELTGKQKEFCCRKHKDAWHAKAMKVGHAVFHESKFHDVSVDVLMSAMKEVASKKKKREKNIKYDLDSMPCQERLGLLCRAAQRMGILNETQG